MAAPTASLPASPSSPAPTARHFSLTGPSRRLDPRVNALRPDIADVALADRVFAPHYAKPLLRSCTVSNTSLLASPSHGARAVSELLLGEGFAVVDVTSEWAWGYSLHDHYVGYVPLTALGPRSDPTHIVSASAALVFAEPEIKAPLRARLPLGARILAQQIAGSFVEVEGGFVHMRHLRRLDVPEADAVSVAERLIGTPYQWGGRSGFGIDCSGLVQLSLAATGFEAPRDSDQQAALGRSLSDAEPLARGDLVFFPGHVGLMADAETMVHANAFWMMTVSEPLVDVVTRLKPQHAEPITHRRRLS